MIRAHSETVRNVLADAACIAAGLSFPFGFAPYGLYPICVVALTAFFSCLYGASPRRALWRGWLFGLASFGVGVSWVQESFQYSHITGLLSVVLASGFVAFLAFYPAVAAYLAVRIPAPAGRHWRLGLLMPALWCGVEWLRGTALSGFTWLQVAYAFVDSPLRGLFPLAGVYGVGLLVAFSAGALAALSSRQGWKHPGCLAFAVLLSVCWGGATLLADRSWTRPAGEPMTVALLQGNVAQADKWKPQMRAPTLARYLNLTRKNWGADLIIWPETAMPGFYHTLSDFVRNLAVEARQNGSAVLAGVPMADSRSRSFRNSVVLLGADANFYHKRHLVPFGEFLPFRSVLKPFTDAMGIPVANFSPGAAVQTPLFVKGQALGVFICFEVSFGADVRAALPAATVLVTVTNDAWFGHSIGPHQHLQIARARALETGRWLLRATNTGLTAIIDAKAQVVGLAPQFEVADLRGVITPMQGTTPYVLWGDWPALVVMVAIGLACVWCTRRRPDAPPDQA